MAIHCATGGDYLQRTTDLLPAGGDRTVLFWARFNSSSAYRIGYVLLDDPGVYSDYWELWYDTDTHFDVAGNGTAVVGQPVVGVWTHFAIVQAGTTQRVYVAGTLAGSYTADLSAMVAGFEGLGNDTFTDGDLDLTKFRSYTRALTQAQIQVEMRQRVAVSTLNLWMDTPLEADLLDVSGNGRHWTAVGAPTILLPANGTAATAAELTPGEYTQDVTTAGPPRYPVWFTYLPGPGEVMLGAWFHVPVGDLTYTPQVTVYTGTPESLIPFLAFQAVSNTPITVPVTDGTRIWFRVENGTSTPTTPTVPLTISILQAPQHPITRGTLLVPDDQDGFPLAVVSPTTSAVLGYLPFPFGEFGEILPDGTMLVEDAHAVTLVIYHPDFTVAATTPFIPGATIVPTSSNRRDRFYIGRPGGGPTHASITAVSLAGVLETSWTLAAAGIVGLAVTRDEQRAYYTGAGSTVNTPVKQWDLIAGAALPDLATSPVGATHRRDLILLDDTTLLVPYQLTGGAGVVLRYDQTGTLLSTYPLSQGSEHLAHGVDDTTFWAWIQAVDSLSHFYEIRVSDGVEVTHVIVPIYEGGVLDSGPTDTPRARFGTSLSCPFLIAQVNVTPPDVPPPDAPPVTVGCPITFPVDPGGGGCGGPMALLP